MSFLAITIPISIGLGAVLLLLVLRHAREGDYDDWEGPAFRMLYDDDSTPECDPPESVAPLGDHAE